MSDQSTELYDAFYAGKDYAGEAASVLRLARARRGSTTSLLDVACGTGRHLEYFARGLRCTGLDLNAEFLDVAKRRCPAASFVVGDMVDFTIDARFDVVTCLFSSIGYVGTVDRLDQSVASMTRCLRPGGLLVVEPWFMPDAWRLGVVSTLTVDTGSGQAMRMATSGRRGDVALLDFHYLVGTAAPSGAAASPEGGADGRVAVVEHFIEHHELGLFTWDQYRHAFEAAGLRFHVDRYGLTGRGLIIGMPGSAR